MVGTEPEMVSQGEEVVESTHRRRQQQEDELLHDKNDDDDHHPFSSLGRQSSIYSLTLDEFQHALSENGKNFGSMNMDEFLASIWTAEENQHHGHPAAPANAASSGSNLKASGLGTRPWWSIIPRGGHLVQQSSLPRQGSLTLPAPLCRKTVDEVWSEIHRSGGQGQRGSGNGDRGNASGAGPAAGRQPTFGEMTLEDFLVKAGVVRENQCGDPAPTLQQYGGVYQGGSGSGNGNGSASLGGGFGVRPIRGGGGVGYAPVGVYGRRVGNGGGGYVSGGGMMGPVSPVAARSDGMVGGGQYGMDMGGLRERKGIIDGPVVEKVVERRQRRMIKNRESAARSRSRKQAYTVELEAELNQLKDENRQLKQALAEMERKRKQQDMEESRRKVPTKAQKARERLRMMRRSLSCPL